MKGIIWSKTQKTFVPISSVPVFATLQQERLRSSRAREIHNFQLQNLTLTSFEEPSFLEFYDSNTRITGLCGELWNILSESLNFTLQPIKSNETSLGEPDKNFHYSHGLLGMIFRNETNVIPKFETFIPRLVNCDFTIPLWMSRHRLYINLETIHDSTWVAKVFSWNIWCTMLAIHILLSVCGFWSQIILARIRDKWKKTTFNDHYFYNFAMLCNQNYIPEVLEGRSRVLETSLSFFCFIMYIAFGAVLFIYMSKRVFISPFDSLVSLVADTKYKVLVINGSLAHITFQITPNMDYKVAENAKRVVVVSTVEEMYKMACYPEKGKYVIFESEEEYLTRGKIICSLTPTGEIYLNMWVASGIMKNFKHKRTIDLGILKLMEVGIWRLLKNRWLLKKAQRDDNVQLAEAITLDQVSLMIAMMYCGMIMAFIILIIEKIVHIYKLKQ